VSAPGDEVGWRFVLAFPLITNMLQLASILLLIETPRFFLVSRNDEDHAKQSLNAIYKEQYVLEELEILKTERIENKPENVRQFFQRFWRQFLLSLNIAIIQQFSGVPAVNFYSNQMFVATGLSLYQAQIYSSIVGVLNFVGGIGTVILTRYGATPRQLMLYGLGIIFADLVCLASLLAAGVYVAARFFIFGFIFFFSMMQRSTVFMIIPNLVPPVGSNIAMSANSVSRFITGYTFLYIWNSAIGISGAFYIYAGGTFLAFIHCLFELPETRGKNFNQIAAIFNHETVSDENKKTVRPAPVAVNYEGVDDHNVPKSA